MSNWLLNLCRVHAPADVQSCSITPLLALQFIAKAADLSSDGDLVNRHVRQKQNWGLMPFAAIIGSVAPGVYMRGIREIFGLYPGAANFPRWDMMGSQRGAASVRHSCWAGTALFLYHRPQALLRVSGLELTQASAFMTFHVAVPCGRCSSCSVEVLI